MSIISAASSSVALLDLAKRYKTYMTKWSKKTGRTSKSAISATAVTTTTTRKSRTTFVARTSSRRQTMLERNRRLAREYTIKIRTNLKSRLYR